MQMSKEDSLGIGKAGVQQTLEAADGGFQGILQLEKNKVTTLFSGFGLWLSLIQVNSSTASRRLDLEFFSLKLYRMFGKFYQNFSDLLSNEFCIVA